MRKQDPMGQSQPLRYLDLRPRRRRQSLRRLLLSSQVVKIRVLLDVTAHNRPDKVAHHLQEMVRVAEDHRVAACLVVVVVIKVIKLARASGRAA